MNAKSDHPFCVDVRASRMSPERFAWRIMTKGGGTWRSPLSYASFEEARRAAQSRLEQLIGEWRANTSAVA